MARAKAEEAKAARSLVAAGGDGEADGGGGAAVGGVDGGFAGQYGPQSAQSEPSSHWLVEAPGLPSSHQPSDPQSGIPMQALLQMQPGVDGPGGGGDGDGGEASGGR